MTQRQTSNISRQRAKGMFGGKGVGTDWEWMRQKVTLDKEAGIASISPAWPAGQGLRGEKQPGWVLFEGSREWRLRRSHSSGVFTG